MQDIAAIYNKLFEFSMIFVYEKKIENKILIAPSCLGIIATGKLIIRKGMKRN